MLRKEFSYHKTRLVSELAEQAKKWLATVLHVDQLDDKDEVAFYLKSAPLNLSKTLEEEGVTGDKPLVTMFHMRVEENMQRPRMEVVPNKSVSEQIMEKELPCPPEYLPKPPAPGYFTKPSMDEMSKMSLRQLQRLPCFDIWNEHGKIHFHTHKDCDGVDVTEVDLAAVVKIQQRDIEVYG